MIDTLKIICVIGIVFLSLIGALVILLKSYDYYLIKKQVISRRNIGCFDTDESWHKCVKDVCCKWAVSVPKVQVTDNMSFILLERIKGNYSRNELQAWQRGGLLIGLSQYLKKKSQDTEVNKVAIEVMQDIFDDNYMWRIKPKEIDFALLAYSILKLPQYNDNYYAAMCEVINMINYSAGEDGTVYYRKSIPKYRLVDTVGMICPFLIRFGTLYNKQELIEFAILQLEKYMEHGIHSKTGIPAHAYHIESKMPLGIYGWGRGVGWYAMGLIDSLEELGDNHPKKEFLKNKVKELGAALIRYQKVDGGWGSSIFLESYIYDSSATAMATYFLAKAECLGLLNDNIYTGVIEKGIKKLKVATRIDGTVDFSQGDTKGIGVYSTVFREFPFTQGIVLALIGQRI